MNNKKCYKCIHEIPPHSICYICEDGDACFEENKEIKKPEDKGEEEKKNGYKDG